VLDCGLILTSKAIGRQLAAMPCELYLIRLIHHPTKRPVPGERLWTADQLQHLATIRFLRARNREGCDIYVQPYAEGHNAGYILVDLDHAEPAILADMCAHGHQPCVVLQTSPGHWQAWVHVSGTPLTAAIATAIGKQLASLYGGDRASTDWRHLGRLAGFTNQKPQRRTRSGLAPWVKVVHTRAGLAHNACALVRSAATQLQQPIQFDSSSEYGPGTPPHPPSTLTPAQATALYQTWIQRWRIRQRFVPPDWSIVDLWIARALLTQGMPTNQVQIILQFGSPGFPRRHANPADYLRRTLARAAFPFPAPGARCVSPPLYATADAGGANDFSNSAGER
jgi:hypothetical protein